MVNVKKGTHEVFGSVVTVSNGIVEVTATTDIGPRIIGLNMVGKANMMYEDVEKAPFLDESHEILGGELARNYGGHRMWVSPEEVPRTYYPDNNPVECSEIENGVRLAAPIEKGNLIQKVIEITLCPDSSKIGVAHYITNCGTWDIEFAVWALTVMAQGGKEVVPQPDRETGLLGNRVVGLWPYAKMNDKRVYWGDKYITLKQDPQAECPFKLGINNEHGWAAYFNKEQLFIKRYTHIMNAEYPDFGICSFQTYTNHAILEIETLAPISKLKPGETASHKECWELYNESCIPSNDENEIKSILDKYI